MWNLVAAIHVFIFMVTCRDAVVLAASSSDCSTLSCFTNPSCPCIDSTTGQSWTFLLPIVISAAFTVLSAVVCCCCCYFRRRKKAKVTHPPPPPTENIRIIRDYDPAVVVAPAQHQPPVFNIEPLSVMSSQYLRPAVYHSPQLMPAPQPMSGYGYGWPSSSSPYMSRPMIGYPGGCQSCTL